MHTNLQYCLIKKKPKFTKILITNFFLSAILYHLPTQIRTKIPQNSAEVGTYLTFILVSKAVAEQAKIYLLKYSSLLLRLFSFKGVKLPILLNNFSSFFNKTNFWFKYGFKINKRWPKSAFFSIVLFSVSSKKYAYAVNKKKYFQFKNKQYDKLTRFVCYLFEIYLKELRKNFNTFKKISLLTNLHQNSNVSRFFIFSLKHLECFNSIYAFTLLAIPYMTFYSFLLDQTYIWSDLVNELQVYFQKGFI
jgi:hypothetical protein